MGADSILRLEINIYCLPRSFNRFPLYFALSSFTEMKRTSIKLQNETSYFLHRLETSVTSKLHKNQTETLGADSILRLEINIYCLPPSFIRFPLYFALSSFTEMKRTSIKLQNETSYFLHRLETSVTSNL